MPPRPTPLDASYIEAKSIPEPNSGCWLWLGAIGHYGYGSIGLRRRKTSAQRASYIVYRGSVPDGHDVDHLCRNPACVNPDHLEVVTHQENCRRRNATKNTCSKGHPYTGTIDARGSRRCLICNAAAARTYRSRALSSAAPPVEAKSEVVGCTCQDQHRKGYCTEPGCPNAA